MGLIMSGIGGHAISRFGKGSRGEVAISVAQTLLGDVELGVRNL